MKKFVRLALSFLLVGGFVYGMSRTPLASAVTQFHSAVVTGQQLKTNTDKYHSLIAKENLEEINRHYDGLIKKLEETEAAIGKVPDQKLRGTLNRKYVKPAKVAKEDTMYRISQYRLALLIENRLNQASLEQVRSDLNKLHRLERRNMDEHPAESGSMLSAKRIRLEQQFLDLDRAYDVNNPYFLFPQLTSLKDRWPRLSEKGKSDALSNDAWTMKEKTKYLGYLPKHIGFLYHVTKDRAYKKMLKDMMPLYKKNYIKNGKLRSMDYQASGWWYRDQFARDSRGLLEAYQYTKLPEILAMVDKQAALWIEKVPRKRNLGYTVFPYGISDKGEIGPYELNPNQNLQVASLFSELYWEPKSAFYQSSLAKDIVFNETEAVLALQKKNGSLPLTQNLTLVEDTNYGGYSGDMLYQLAQVWGNRKWMEADVKIGEWLFNEYTKEHPWNTPDDAPNYAIDRNSSFNLISRVLPFYAAGIPDDSVRNWIHFSETRFPDEKLYLLERWYIAQSIPRDYLDPDITRKNQLPPRIYAEASRRSVSARIIAEEISGLQITIAREEDSKVSSMLSTVEDVQKEIPLQAGNYVISFKAAESNGTISSASKTFTLPEATSVHVDVLLFDRSHRFHEKIQR
ncbi:hypothetical protein [Bacillus sp. FJAT-42376]|uniref:hypothetical protein n=1 Tax=Bacillus sp. FJAT-42376 TaxID=2014076 RepID=UPI000F4D441C|nr:hypothetical protein [Bacillus sp. FJAT-42376]